MKLKHITFTGIDARTDVQMLRAIQEQHPIAEFGVLTSYHWYDNGNRYIDPRSLSNLCGLGLNLALHVCGSLASRAADGYWDSVDHLLVHCLGLFGRVQLNIANRTDNPYRLASEPTSDTEVIIQQKEARDIEFFERSKWMNISLLLDASGGRGVDTPINVLPNAGKAFKVGYAGGITPDNVADKLSYLMENENVGDFWIDMETGVRTNDWFDLEKVSRVLEICEPLIEKYKEGGE